MEQIYRTVYRGKIFRKEERLRWGVKILKVQKNFSKKKFSKKKKIFFSLLHPPATHECPQKFLSPIGPAVWPAIRMTYKYIRMSCFIIFYNSPTIYIWFIFHISPTIYIVYISYFSNYLYMV